MFDGGLDAARTILQDRFGHARFRVHQLKVLGPLLAGRNVLAVRRRGAGKWLCYQVPALLSTGLTLVISPLISLMQDQVGALRRRGIAAAYLNSQLDADQRRVVLDAATSGRLALLYCAPERLGSLTRRLTSGDTRVTLLAIDEAHCITEWGNEFRPVYRRLGMFRSLLGRPPTIALTGSATPAARADILHVLRMPDADVVVTSFDRPNLIFATRRVRDDRERFAAIRARARRAGRVVDLHADTPSHRARHARAAPDQRARCAVSRRVEREHPAPGAARVPRRSRSRHRRDERLRHGDRQAGCAASGPLGAATNPRGLLPGGGASRAGRRSFRVSHPVATAGPCMGKHRAADAAIYGSTRGPP